MIVTRMGEKKKMHCLFSCFFFLCFSFPFSSSVTHLLILFFSLSLHVVRPFVSLAFDAFFSLLYARNREDILIDRTKNKRRKKKKKISWSNKNIKRCRFCLPTDTTYAIPATKAFGGRGKKEKKYAWDHWMSCAPKREQDTHRIEAKAREKKKRRNRLANIKRLTSSPLNENWQRNAPLVPPSQFGSRSRETNEQISSSLLLA